jgi:hypothetical protein
MSEALHATHNIKTLDHIPTAGTKAIMGILCIAGMIWFAGMIFPRVVGVL